jgi:hypothetical protein
LLNSDRIYAVFDAGKAGTPARRAPAASVWRGASPNTARTVSAAHDCDQLDDGYTSLSELRDRQSCASS